MKNMSVTVRWMRMITAGFFKDTIKAVPITGMVMSIRWYGSRCSSSREMA
jgi:hypothetical protein